MHRVLADYCFGQSQRDNIFEAQFLADYFLNSNTFKREIVTNVKAYKNWNECGPWNVKR